MSATVSGLRAWTAAAPRPVRRVIVMTCLWLFQAGVLFCAAVLLVNAQTNRRAYLITLGVALITASIVALIIWISLAWDDGKDGVA